MTREQFDDLVREVNARAAACPRRHRRRVAGLGLLGYGFVWAASAACAAVLAGLVWSLGQDWFRRAAAHEFRLRALWPLLELGVTVLLVVLLRALRVRWPAPAGRRLGREEAPALFTLIDEVARAAGTPAPRVVLLTAEFNASVVQRPRPGWRERSRDFLLLGWPLLAALGTDEFRSVLAHEFAHLRGRHARLSNWVYRLRSVWGQLLERRNRPRRVSALVFGRFAEWFTPRFQAHTGALARRQELEADAAAARLAGRAAAAGALVRTFLAERRLQEEFWRPLGARTHREPAVPAGLLAEMVRLVGRPLPAARRAAWLRAALAEEAPAASTHPALAERLRGLGYVVEAGAVPGLESVGAEDPAGPSAAEVLLAGCPPALFGELDQHWRGANAPQWEASHARGEFSRERLAALAPACSPAADGDPEAREEAQWEAIQLRAELAAGADPEASRRELADFVARWPGHARSRLELGRALLGGDDPAGVAWVEEAARLDVRTKAEAAAALAGYLRRAGRTEEADRHRREALRQADRLDAANQERRRWRRRDPLEPHGLAAEEREALRSALARQPGVAAAWLARRRVVHHPDWPCYVLVCTWRRPAKGAGAARREEALRRGVRVGGRGDFFLLTLDARRAWRSSRLRRVRAVPGSRCYSGERDERREN